MNATKPIFSNKTIAGKYVIQQKLKVGGFSYVYTAKDIKQPNKYYAIKLMPMASKKYASIELNLYELLKKYKVTTGFVKCYDEGDFMDHKYLLMELIGADLEELKKKISGERMSIKTAIMIGLQMIDRLQALHRIGFVHRDVKPDNLAIGLQEKSKVIYLFDFGLAHPIGAEQPKEEKGKVVGTLGFMSCRAHEGKNQGPSDDIQSLIYTLLYLAEGSLPWLKMQIRSPVDFHKILLAKRGLNKKSFKNQSIPQELFLILDEFQRLKVNEKIDYLKLKFRLLQCLKSIGSENDFAFDWLSQTERKKDPLSPLKKKKSESPIDERYQKKLEIMNEENQQLVQKQIYQVYKFMENCEEKDNGNADKRRKNKSKSPPKKIEPSKVEQAKEKAKVRPVSAANKPKRSIQEIQQPWQKILNFENSNSVSGPRIVINKTAKHKI